MERIRPRANGVATTTVAIVGLGTAGAAAAALCARRGLRVIGLERGPLGVAGARWVNGVPVWAYQYAGLTPPSEPEHRGGHAPVHLIAGWNGRRVRLRSVIEVDMRHLVARLQGIAVEHGALLYGEAVVSGWDGTALDTSVGRIEADVVVDASGLTGARLLDQPRIAATDLCAAAQEVRALADPAAARAFFAVRGAQQGDVLIFTGIAGGYSILNVHFDHEHVALLTGSIPALGHPSGRAVLDRFVASRPWIGERVFGGARAIPLRRPWPVIGRGSVALIGDAACQVFAAHGSGIAQQLVAARVLADALEDGSGPQGYNVRWQRRWGGTLAGSDLFRRFSQDLSVPELDRLMATGALSAGLMRDAMVQRPPAPTPAVALRSAAGLLRLPALARRMAPVVARMQLVAAHYRRYPSDPASVPRWTQALERLSAVPESGVG